MMKSSQLAYRGFMPGPLHNEEAQVTMGDVSDHQPVVLNTQQMGNECVIVKNGRRICGKSTLILFFLFLPLLLLKVIGIENMQYFSSEF